MRKITNSFQSAQKDALSNKGKVFKGKSMTIVDDTMSIMELVERATKGVVPLERLGSTAYRYHNTNDPYDVQPRINDLTDLDKMRSIVSDTKERIKQIEQQHKAEAEAKAKAEAEAKRSEASNDANAS